VHAVTTLSLRKCVDEPNGLNCNFCFNGRDMDAADRTRMLEWTRGYDLLRWLIHLGEHSKLRVFESLGVWRSYLLLCSLKCIYAYDGIRAFHFRADHQCQRCRSGPQPARRAQIETRSACRASCDQRSGRATRCHNTPEIARIRASEVNVDKLLNMAIRRLVRTGVMVDWR